MQRRPAPGLDPGGRRVEAAEERGRRGRRSRSGGGAGRLRRRDEDEAATARRRAAAGRAQLQRGRSPRRPPRHPPVRSLAKELGVDLATVAGTGPGGRVTREDVEQAAAAARRQPPAPEPPLPRSHRSRGRRAHPGRGHPPAHRREDGPLGPRDPARHDVPDGRRHRAPGASASELDGRGRRAGDPAPDRRAGARRDLSGAPDAQRVVRRGRRPRSCSTATSTWASRPTPNGACWCPSSGTPTGRGIVELAEEIGRLARGGARPARSPRRRWPAARSP